MTGKAVAIRAAAAADVEALAALAARTFRDTFERDNDPADMDAYVARWFSRQRLAAELADPSSRFFLAFGGAGDRPLGYAKLAGGAPDPAVTGPRPIGLERLYVDRRALGRGVGAALMRRAIAEARTAGFGTLWLGVWEKNPRAIAFYGRWGFATVGEHVFRLGADPQRDLVMQRPL